jgi:pheromone shutdown-related protein TraB
MHHYKNLAILGTSHISSLSIREIEREFSSQNPDIVAVELDRNRFEALRSKEKQSYSIKLIRQIGLTGYFFALIGGILQKKLGDFVGVAPGSEMLRATQLAQANGKRLALIDQNIIITLNSLSRQFTFREKIRLVYDLISSPFSKKLSINLKGVPEKQVIRELLGVLKKRYPGLYCPLIAERNNYMAEKLTSIIRHYPEMKILAVVGAGHEEELAKIIEAAFAELP